MVIGSHHSKNNPVLEQGQIQMGAAKGKLRQISDRGEFDSFLAEIFQALPVCDLCCPTDSLYPSPKPALLID